MAVDFRGHPMIPQTGFNAPTRFESDVYDHSHLSEAYAVGTADESPSGPILKFIEAPPR